MNRVNYPAHACPQQHTTRIEHIWCQTDHHEQKQKMVVLAGCLVEFPGLELAAEMLLEQPQVIRKGSNSEAFP